MSFKWLLTYRPSFVVQMAVFQLVLAVGCFYAYYKFQGLDVAYAAKALTAEAKINEMQCDAINKEVAISLLRRSVKDRETIAELALCFGIIATGFTLAAFGEIRRRRVAKT